MDALPPGVEDTVQMILSSDTPAKERKEAESRLVQLQKSPEGWILARAFLRSPYKEVRFYGPLTYTVKLNSDGQSLSVEDARGLLEQLMSDFVNMVFSGEASFVVLKMCSTLATFFLRFPDVWARCAKHCICSLALERMISFEDLEQAPPTQELVQGLTLPKLLYAIQLFIAIADEAEKTDPNNPSMHAIHSNLHQNIEDVLVAINFTFDWFSNNTETRPDLDEVTNSAVKCLSSWIIYCHRAFSRTDFVFLQFQPLLIRLIPWAASVTVGDAVVELFVDLLQNFVEILSKGMHKLLHDQIASPWGLSQVELLAEGDLSDTAVSYSRLFFAYTTAEHLSFPTSPESPSSRAVLDIMLKLGNCAFAGSDDCVWVALLEFYTTYVETFLENSNSEDSVAVAAEAHAKTVVRSFLAQLWIAAQFRENLAEDWTSLDIEAFRNFRRESQDFIEATYPFIGPEIVTNFVHAALDAHSRSQFEAVEAALFFISALSDQILEDTTQDELLRTLLQSNILEDVISRDYANKEQTLYSISNSLGSLVTYFERDSSVLSFVLPYLFKCLASTKARNIAARSIYKICSGCRTQLKGFANDLVQQYMRIMSTDNKIELYVQEKVLGAVASVIEGLGQTQDQLTGVRLLLGTLKGDIQQINSLNEISSPEASLLEASQEHIISILKCLQAIGKGMEANDEVIDLDKNSDQPSLWDSSEGVEIRRDIFEILKQMLHHFKTVPEILQACCDVIKSGLRETSSGPFVFDKLEIVQFLTVYGNENQQPEIAAFTMGYVLASQTSEQKEGSIVVVRAILAFFGSKVPNMDTGPEENPELGQAILVGLTKLLQTNLRLLLTEEADITGRLLRFSLKCLEFKLPFPRREASTFWTRFLALQDQSTEIQSLVDQVNTEYGPHLARIIIFSIAGQCARSEIDIFCDPLRKMIFRQKNSKTWLENALKDPLFPSNSDSSQMIDGDNNNGNDDGDHRISDLKKRVFLQKIMNARGGKSTNGFVKDFWLECRGSLFQYIS